MAWKSWYASGFGECVDLPVEQLSLRRYACVPDKGAGQCGRNGREEISGGVVRRLLHPEFVQKTVGFKFLSTPTF